MALAPIDFSLHFISERVPAPFADGGKRTFTSQANRFAFRAKRKSGLTKPLDSKRKVNGQEGFEYKGLALLGKLYNDLMFWKRKEKKLIMLLSWPGSSFGAMSIDNPAYYASLDIMSTYDSADDIANYRGVWGRPLASARQVPAR